MKFAFVMDPMAAIKPKKDTTFALMRAAAARGHHTAHIAPQGLHLEDGRLWLEGVWVRTDEGRYPPFAVGEPALKEAADWDAIWVRTDPPFDEAYLRTTWLLDRVPPGVPVINSPAGLRAVSEKLWVTQFANLTPPTLVTPSWQQARGFLQKHGEAILKPVDGFGGQSVFRLRHGDSNARVAFETLSRHGRESVILQRYLEAAEQGDKRVLVLDGKPLGAVMRMRAAGEHRNNIAAGGDVRKAAVTAGDEAIVSALRPHLQSLGLHFVGLDIIGGKLVEVNVTSPTCLQEMQALDGRDYEGEVIAWAEALAESRKRQGAPV